MPRQAHPLADESARLLACAALRPTDVHTRMAVAEGWPGTEWLKPWPPRGQ